MPYVYCPRCGLNSFSAAYWSTVERCARCDTELPRRSRAAGAERARLSPEPRLSRNGPERPTRIRIR